MPQPDPTPLDHLIGAGEQHRWDVQAESVGRIEVYGDLVLGRFGLSG